MYGSAWAGFGFKPGAEGFDGSVLNADGSPDTQAGSHPYEATTSFAFDTKTDNFGQPVPDGDAKDIEVELPPGFIGNPDAVPRCPIGQFDVIFNTPFRCPADSQVGVASVTIAGLGESGADDSPVPVPSPVYSLVPRAGAPVELGFYAFGIPVVLSGRVRTGGDYGVTVAADNALTQSEEIYSSTLTIWGVPAESSHTAHRYCSERYYETGCPSGGQLKPFLTLPTSCEGPLTTTIRADSWQEPGIPKEAFFLSHDNSTPPVPVGIHGCGRLQFSPTIAVRPDTTAADSPAGLEVDLGVPQNEDPEGFAEADLKEATITLPAGMTVNPSAANGLAACSIEQIGFKRFDEQTQTEEFTPSPPSCPDASKLAGVEIKTPLLEETLEGSIYLARQDSNPFGSLLAIYLVAEDKAKGVLIKLAGEVHADPVTGQLAATFKKNPQLPFSDLKVQFFGGPRAALTNPATCGTYSTATALTPWSAPESGPPATPPSSFQVTSGPEGTPCPSPQSFAPSFATGMTGTARAGAFSPFSVTLSRQDGQQTLSRVSVQTPPGLLGMLSQVPLCGEAQANAGTCSAASQIGHTIVAAGVGPDPLYLPAPGQPQNPVYLTGPYEGAPFGLSIVVPAVAGPFNLGTVVVRAAIHIDPRTAQVTVTSDPLPQMLQGIPLQVKTVNVLVDRPGFMFNPTNCNALSAGGTITGAGGASVKVSSPFQAHDCALLPFAPKFTISTQAKTSHARGASLDFKVVDRPGQANIREVKVQLPKRLPARLTTLQKACTDTVFEANPAKCPAASDVGTAVAQTPVLPVKLAGPAYLVSHGGRAFPDLEIVLQGEGVTILLDGGTNIKKGITTSTFSTVPDAPISSFELRLPEGPHSALAANGNLCTGTPAMPTVTAGQNGAQIKETLRIKVTGCPKK